MDEPNIVLVEDDNDTRVLLKFLLEWKGYSVTATGDGQIALKIIEEQRPDVIITDLMMPNINGLDLIRRARELHPTVPILLISGNGDIIKDDALRAGATRIFLKPFDSDELLQTIYSLTQKHLERNA